MLYPRMINLSIPLQLQQPGDENGYRLGRYRPARCANPNPTGVIADCLWLMEPARGESYTSGQRQRPAAPREDRVSSSVLISFHISTTPTTRRRKRRSPGSIPPRRVWKPQPNWLVANWLRLACGESFPSGQRRGSAAPGEDTFPSPHYKSFHIPTTPTTRRRKRRSPG